MFWGAGVRGKGAKGSEENFLIPMETWASWKQKELGESEVASLQFQEHCSQVVVSPEADGPVWGVAHLSGSCVRAHAGHSTLLEAASLPRGFSTHTGVHPRTLGQAVPQLCFLWQDVRMVCFHGTVVSWKASEEQEGWSVQYCEMLTIGGRRED